MQLNWLNYVKSGLNKVYIRLYQAVIDWHKFYSPLIFIKVAFLGSGSQMYARPDQPDLSGGNQDGWIEMEKVSQKYIIVN